MGRRFSASKERSIGMRLRTLIGRTAAIGPALYLISGALAQTPTIGVDPTASEPRQWSDPNIWLVDGTHPKCAPGANDCVVINHNVVVSAANAAAQVLTVNSGVTLAI